MCKDNLELAFQAFDNERYDEAEKSYRECLNISAGNSSVEKIALHGLGFTLAFKKEYEESLICYQRVLSIAKKDKNVTDEAIALHQIAMVHRMAKNYKIALKVFEQENALRKQFLLADNIGFSANFYELGFIALQENHFNDCRNYFEEALRYAQLAKDEMCIACARRGLGQYFQKIGNHLEAKEAYKKSILAFEKVDCESGAEEVRVMLDYCK